MHIIDHTALGILIIVLLAALVAVKRITTGSLFETPEPRLLLWLVNIFNLFFLLVANPVVAILLVTGKMDGIDPTFWEISPAWLMVIVEIIGLAVYLAGFFLMAWALVGLGGNYQLGGSAPREADKLVAKGPYAFVRHPMYTSALCIAIGLAFLTGSLAVFGVFVVYCMLILLLIPIEEQTLLGAYGEQYDEYRRRVGKLIPFI